MGGKPLMHDESLWKKFYRGRIFRLTLPASAGITYVKLAQHKIRSIPDVRPHDLVG